MAEEIIGTTLAHSAFGGPPDCWGCLNGIVDDEDARIVCNGCNAVVRRVPVDQLRKTLDEMELTLNVVSAKCPYCGSIHMAPGFSQLFAFVCDACGRSVEVKDKP